MIPFKKDLYFKCLAWVILALVGLFTVSIVFFGYEMTSADPGGAFMASLVAAYLVHLLVGQKHFMNEGMGESE